MFVRLDGSECLGRVYLERRFLGLYLVDCRHRLDEIVFTASSEKKETQRTFHKARVNIPQSTVNNRSKIRLESTTATTFTHSISHTSLLILLFMVTLGGLAFLRGTVQHMGVVKVGLIMVLHQKTEK